MLILRPSVVSLFVVPFSLKRKHWRNEFSQNMNVQNIMSRPSVELAET